MANEQIEDVDRAEEYVEDFVSDVLDQVREELREKVRRLFESRKSIDEGELQKIVITAFENTIYQ